MSLVWAPRNEVTLLLIIAFRAVTFEATIMSFSAWYIGMEVLVATFEGFAIATATLHLMGAAAGFGVGTLMLKKAWSTAKTGICSQWKLRGTSTGPLRKPHCPRESKEKSERHFRNSDRQEKEGAKEKVSEIRSRGEEEAR